MKKLLSAVFVFLFCANCVFAVDMSKEINAATDKIMPKVVEWRRHLHQYPELSNREFKTSKYVEDNLRRLGLEVKTGVAKTGVVGILKGAQPGPVIGLRADMDALPVTERNDLPFMSKEKSEYNGQTVGVMHACGHDTHVAMLLGAAEVLAGMKDKIKGTVVFIFQPAEEGAPAGEEGGAALMVKEGVLDNPKVDAVFGIHINAQTEIGTIKYKSGSFMASSDWFSIKIKGKQTHGAYPWLGIDTITTAAQIVNGLQLIVSRQSELTKSPVVITVGKINAGVRENIIPEELTMAGTIRTLDSEMQKDVHERIRQTATKIAESVGATAEVSIETKTLVTYNTPDLVKKMLPSLEKAAGKENVQETSWVMGAEDFSILAQKVPGMFFFLGVTPPGEDPREAPANHSPLFHIHEPALKYGVRSLAYLAIDYLRRGA